MGGTPSAPKLPKYKPVDIPATQALAQKAAQQGYALSDADRRKRLGPILNAEQAAIAENSRQMAGAIPAQATGALTSAGLGPEASSLVGANEFETARNLNINPLQASLRHRNYFEQELSNNPERGDLGGLTGEGYVKLLLANSGLANQFQQYKFGTQLQNFQTGQAQQAQNIGAITSLIAGLGTDAAKFANPSAFGYTNPYTNPFGGGAYSPIPYYGEGSTTSQDLGPALEGAFG